MPNIKSAKKRIRTDAVKNIRNRSRKSAIKTIEKKFRTNIVNNNTESAKELLSRVVSSYDKAAKVGTVHRNRANRKKSRLTRLLNKSIVQ